MASLFQCQECGKLFRTVRAAERAYEDGCPKCGGCDIDLAPPVPIWSIPAGQRNKELVSNAARLRKGGAA